MPVKTIPSDQWQGALHPKWWRNVSTTRQKVTLPAGTVAVVIGYQDNGSASGKHLHIAVNALDDTDASDLLDISGSSGNSIVCPLGKEVMIRGTTDDPLTRLDWKTEATESGASIVSLLIVARAI